MVISKRQNLREITICPHCGSNCIVMDKLENEPYCYICGWRHSIRISPEHARNHFTSERAFWLNLFALQEDPDDTKKRRN